ncbi:unnamed protein product [Alopecurus aequalis]
MAATTCAYGYDSSCPPSAPAPAAMGFPTAARSLQVRDPFHNRSHSHVVLGSIIPGVVVMPPPPAPPPPPLPPPLLDLHLGPRSNHSSSKTTSRDPGLCTEGLGSESSESSGDVDLGDVGDAIEEKEAEQALHHKRQHFDGREEKTRTRGRRAFPPPISVIGAAGKPWQYLRAHRGDGRLVLREVRIPSRELLQACREDGRLKLHFAHPE